MTTMKSLAGKDILQVLLIAYKHGEKACEINITKMSPREVREEIELQEMQGRTWSYTTIKKYQFKELGKEGALFAC